MLGEQKYFELSILLFQLLVKLKKDFLSNTPLFASN